MDSQNTNSIINSFSFSGFFYRWKLNIFFVFPLLFSNAVFAQLYISPGTELKIEENSVITVKQTLEKTTNSEKAIVYISSDAFIYNIDQLKADVKLIHLESKNKTLASQKTKSTRSLIVDKRLPEKKEKIASRNPQQPVFKSSPSENRFLFTNSHQQCSIVPVNQNQPKPKLFTLLNIKNDDKVEISLLRNSTTNNNIFEQIKSSPFSKQSFARPPPFI